VSLCMGSLQFFKMGSNKKPQTEKIDLGFYMLKEIFLKLQLQEL
jgi:hypothetical protein